MKSNAGGARQKITAETRGQWAEGAEKAVCDQGISQPVRGLLRALRGVAPRLSGDLLGGVYFSRMTRATALPSECERLR